MIIRMLPGRSTGNNTLRGKGGPCFPRAMAGKKAGAKARGAIPQAEFAVDPLLVGADREFEGGAFVVEPRGIRR